MLVPKPGNEGESSPPELFLACVAVCCVEAVSVAEPIDVQPDTEPTFKAPAGPVPDDVCPLAAFTPVDDV